VIVVRKLGLPGHEEYAMGAIGEDGVRVLDADVVARARLSGSAVASVERRERDVLEARVAQLRRGRPALSLRGRTVIIVDDGIATGSTARAACQVARRRGAVRIVVAAPVAPAGITPQELAADDVVCCAMPALFLAVGDHYGDFSPTTDREVEETLLAASMVAPGGSTRGSPAGDPDGSLVRVTRERPGRVGPAEGEVEEE
jgi:putative phosphoribosyl transferase